MPAWEIGIAWMKTELPIAEHDSEQPDKHSEHFEKKQESNYKAQNVAAHSYCKRSQQRGHWGKISEWLDSEAVKTSSGKIKDRGRH